MSGLQAVLFDWDGTLVDSAEASYRCYVRLFGRFVRRIKRRFVGCLFRRDLRIFGCVVRADFQPEFIGRCLHGHPRGVMQPCLLPEPGKHLHRLLA